jgi:Uma2 family endonuclease
MTAIPQKFYTPEEYLELERDAPYKSEYYQGRIYPMGDFEGQTPEAMAGTRAPHNTVKENLSVEIGSFLKQTRTCRSYSSDQRIFIPKNGLYTYPDLAVVCGKPDFGDNEQFLLLNPMLLVEVLSAGTASYDRAEKFEFYRSIPTLQEYLTVDSRRVNAELWRKTGENGWLLAQEVRDLDAAITLASLGLTVRLADVYANVDHLPAADFVLR